MFSAVNLLEENGNIRLPQVQLLKKHVSTENIDKIWTVPGHLLYTLKSDTVLLSCEIFLADNAATITEAKNLELTFTSPVLRVLHVGSSNSCYIVIVVFENGDIDTLEYTSEGWFKVGETKLIVDESSVVKEVGLNKHEGFLVWIEKKKDCSELTAYSLWKCCINIGTNEKFSTGTVFCIIKNLPFFRVHLLKSNVLVFPFLADSTNIFLMYSSQNNFKLCSFNAGGTLINSSSVKLPLDFFGFYKKHVRFWVRNCKDFSYLHGCSRNSGDVFYLVTKDGSIVSLDNSGKVNKSVSIGTDQLAKSVDCCINGAFVQVFCESSVCIYSLSSGSLLQDVKTGTIKGVLPSPMLSGYWTKEGVFKVSLSPLMDILSRKEQKELETLLIDEHLQVLYIFQGLLRNNEALPVTFPDNLSSVLQSEALLYSLCQILRECKNGFQEDRLLVQILKNEWLLKTKLNRILKPLVECYRRLEMTRMTLTCKKLSAS